MKPQNKINYEDFDTQLDFNNYVEELYNIGCPDDTHAMLSDLDEWIHDCDVAIEAFKADLKILEKKRCSDEFVGEFGSRIEEMIDDLEKFVDYVRTYEQWLSSYYTKNHYEID